MLNLATASEDHMAVPVTKGSKDSDVVRRAIADLSEQWTEQPDLDLLVNNALDQPQVFVHREYHTRNLMVAGEASPGILDFQDAVEGPLTYDLVSLLKDCYVTWPADKVDAWRQSFYDGLDPMLQAAVEGSGHIRATESSRRQAGLPCRCSAHAALHHRAAG